MPIMKKSPAPVQDQKIEVVLIDSLKLWKENPRRNDQAVEPLSKILAKHGQRSAVIAWRKNGVIYKGNTTWKALKHLGQTHIKVQWEDFPSEAAATAYGISDNKASEFSEWDDDVLFNLLSAEELTALKGDLGFSEDELRGLALEPNIGKIDKLKKTDTGILATIKITCLPEERDEIRDVLTGWAKDSGYKNVVVK